MTDPMPSPDNWPANEPLPEVDLDKLRVGARLLDDYRLDELIAVYAARRNVAAAHVLPSVADTWNNALVALAEVRDERTRTRRDFEDIVSAVRVDTTEGPA